jgi:hypothetical protein
MSEALERRARQVRSRLLLRGWQFRQRHHAAGVWFRLRRLLADASAAYAIPEAEAHLLVAEGHVPEPVGDELEPPKVILFVSPERLARIEGAGEVPLRLGGELLAARHLALLRFPRWDEAIRDPLFLKDLEDVEDAFHSADAETASRLG